MQQGEKCDYRKRFFEAGILFSGEVIKTSVDYLAVVYWFVSKIFNNSGV